MNTNPSYIEELIVRYLQQDLTGEEAAALEAWKNENEANRRFFEQLTQKDRLLDKLAFYARNNGEAERNKAVQHLFPEAPLSTAPVRSIRRWSWAAAVVLLLAGSAGLLYYSQKDTPASKAVAGVHDVAPGREGAILTLADGTQVVLDSLGNGLIATQNGTEVTLRNGQLSYDPNGSANGEMTYNSITTPKGRQFSLMLPDGTRVWLNSASSLRYPTTFAGKEREVEITGEAYFEVKPSPGGTPSPFLVNANGQATIEVLGTHFNINAYSNERTLNTTLLEGSVRVYGASNTGPRAGRSVVIRPGQQAQIAPGSEAGQQPIRVIREVDVEKVVAWKNGVFNFEDVAFDEAMRQLERWFDIEVVYENGIPDIELGGEMTKDISLSQVMRNLSDVGVQFRLEQGNKLIVSQKKR